MDDLEVTIGEPQSRSLEMNFAHGELAECLAELVEHRHVLRETSVFFRRVSGRRDLQRNDSIPVLFPRLGRIDSGRDSIGQAVASSFRSLSHKI